MDIDAHLYRSMFSAIKNAISDCTNRPSRQNEALHRQRQEKDGVLHIEAASQQTDEDPGPANEPIISKEHFAELPSQPAQQQQPPYSDSDSDDSEIRHPLPGRTWHFKQCDRRYAIFGLAGTSVLIVSSLDASATKATLRI